MPKTFDQVERFSRKNESRWVDLSIDLEKEIVRARDMDGVPIYLTKMRIKKPASAYLKSKRKAKAKLDDITDWLGVRVLCLFHQDIVPVHKFLMKFFLGPVCRNIGGTHASPVHIREVTVFNWEPAEKPEQIERSIVDALAKNNGVDFASDSGKTEGERKFIYAFKNAPHSKNYTLIYSTENRGSGYKSVHYSVTIAGTTIEFQLRTLLQDVWGELEHALSYKKGKIHPHIRNSFQLLSRELRAKDILVSQLRDVSEKERSFSLYARVKSGPSKWLGYDKSFVSKLPRSTRFKQFLQRYFAEFYGEGNIRDTWTSMWCDRIEKILEEGEADSASASGAAKYFFDMERAFLFFCRGKIEKAKEIYEEHANKRNFRDRWVVQYRLGEIHAVSGEIDDALVRFDRCEALLRKVNVKDRDLKGEFYAKQKLANVYWSLGEEYMEIAVEKILEAEALFPRLQKTGRVTKREHTSLLNNLCYYALERYIRHLPTIAADRKFDSVEKRFEAGNELDARFTELKCFIEKNPDTTDSNVYDTLAWCAFNKYKALVGEKLGASDVTPGGPANIGHDWLKLAYSYLEKLDGKSNNAPSPLISMAIQRDHLQEIMTAYDIEIRGTPLQQAVD